MSSIMRRPPALLLLVPAAVMLVMLYPAGLEIALRHAGARGVAFAMAAIGLGGLPWARRRRSVSVSGLEQGAFAALLAAAIAFDDPVFLQLLPALVQWVLFSRFRASLREPMSLIERGARMLQPHAPDFIAGYCRGVTAVWSAFFLVNAVAIAGLAVAAPASWWRAYTSWILMAAVMLIFAVEFAVRKSRFRYYAGGPVDRLWSALLPAQNTELGRRSMAYIRSKRAELGMEPPPP